MIKSMTGYGKAEAVLPGGRLTVEIRSLNAKNADINLKTSLLPKDKEMEIRSKIAAALQRGTIDLFLAWEPAEGEAPRAINAALVRTYYDEVRRLRESLPGFAMGSSQAADRMNNELLTAILRFPDVVDARKADVITPEAWPAVEKAVDEALAALDAFRSQEGRVLYEDVTSRVGRILSIYEEIESMEGERIGAVRARLQKNLDEFAQKPDPNRFEQELIYYLEKYDINEEKVRLRQHCKYFMDTIDGEPCPGKKLGFIIQEMGREINTTGSKANHVGIQKCVVRMKDELEKIREQSMNIL